jgi:MoaA/NifB/PqqE/SkfB family radical SAM enzyme
VNIAGKDTTMKNVHRDKLVINSIGGGYFALKTPGSSEILSDDSSNYSPSDMLVEITNRCNNRCVFCPHTNMKSPFGDIDACLLNRLLQEAYEMGVRRVGLYTIGEMFLCKEVATHIINAKRIGYEYIYSDTNGILANEKNLTSVIEAGLDSIKFSINAGTSETYKALHGNDSFDEVMENLKTCHKLKQQLNHKLRIMVSYVVTKQNESEIELLKEKISPYVTDELMVSPVFLSPSRSYNVNGQSLIPTTMECGKIPKPCTMIFNRIHITYDGCLTACCQDFNYELLLGDLKKISLKEAWNSPNAMLLRKAHINGDLEGILCNNCFNDVFQNYTPLKL